jgi:hypothetical protein
MSQMNPFSRLFCSRVLFRFLNQSVDGTVTSLLTSIRLRECGLNAPLIWVILRPQHPRALSGGRRSVSQEAAERGEEDAGD